VSTRWIPRGWMWGRADRFASKASGENELRRFGNVEGLVIEISLTNIPINNISI